MITSMKLKRLKKVTTKKIQNLITSIQSRVPNNTKIHQPIVEMQEKKKSKKRKKKKFEREKERNNILCVRKPYIKWEREL